MPERDCFDASTGVFHRSFLTLLKAQVSVKQGHCMTPSNIRSLLQEVKEECEGNTACRVPPKTSSRPPTWGPQTTAGPSNPVAAAFSRTVS